MRFTTGAIRIEADRRHVTLPRLGAVRTHESTRKLARRIEAGTARILSATVRQDSAGRWHCALQVIVEARARPAHPPRSDHSVVGVDVGVKADALLVVAARDGTEVDRVPATRSLTAAQSRLRALGRRAARRHDVVVVETLNAVGMRSKGGAYKRGLNRALADAALAEGPPHARLQNSFVRKPSGGGRPLLSVVEDVHGPWEAKAKPHPGRSSLRL